MARRFGRNFEGFDNPERRIEREGNFSGNQTTQKGAMDRHEDEPYGDEFDKRLDEVEEFIRTQQAKETEKRNEKDSKAISEEPKETKSESKPASIKESDENEGITNKKTNIASIEKSTEISSSEIQPINEQAEQAGDNFYQKFGILPTDDWETIKGKLRQEQKKWILRENATSDRQVLEEIERELEDIREALRIFNPKNAEKRKQYDEMIAEEQTAEIARDEEETKSTGLCRIPGTSSKKIGFASVERSVRNNPVGIQHLKEVQQEIADEVNNRDRQSKNIKEDELEK